MMVDRSQITEFIQEWAQTLVRGTAMIAVLAVGLVVYWLTMFLPYYTAAFIHSGLLPWQAGFMPVDEPAGYGVLAAEVVWIALILSAGMAASRTFGAETNEGDE